MLRFLALTFVFLGFNLAHAATFPGVVEDVTPMVEKGQDPKNDIVRTGLESFKTRSGGKEQDGAKLARNDILELVFRLDRIVKLSDKSRDDNKDESIHITYDGTGNLDGMVQILLFKQLRNGTKRRLDFFPKQNGVKGTKGNEIVLNVSALNHSKNKKGSIMFSEIGLIYTHMGTSPIEFEKINIGVDADTVVAAAIPIPASGALLFSLLIVLTGTRMCWRRPVPADRSAKRCDPHE